MKKLLLTLFLTVVVTAVVQAQQISVVSPGGDTDFYRTLREAIKEASPGSVIYLPGGGFTIADSVKITKKLTIIGIGHKANNDNADGVTTISGNLYFNQGSSGSAVMGCYITGNINIGNDNTSVNDILIRYCNVSSVYVKSSLCLGTVVNQNYIRSLVYSESNSAAVEITNNVINRISYINGGEISNNVITCQRGSSSSNYPLHYIKNSIVNNNIFLNNYNPTSTSYSGIVSCSYNSFSGNMFFRNETEDNDSINMTGVDPNVVFKNYNDGKVDPFSNFHFADSYTQYEHQVGIYAGDDFNDNQLAPVPYIVAKHVDPQTDTTGKLNIKIRVKAGQ